MDDIDRHLLRELQHDAARPLHVLGELVGLSAAAVQRRITRLKATGPIDRTVCLLDHRAAGVATSVITLVALHRDGPDDVAALLAELDRRPEVLQVHELVGARDLAILSVVPDLDTYATTIADLLDGDPNVARFESHVSLRTHKRTTAVAV